MPAKPTSSKGKTVNKKPHQKDTNNKKVAGSSKPSTVIKPEKASGSKAPGGTKSRSPNTLPPADNLREAIIYFQLLSFCPSGRAADFLQNTRGTRKALAASAGMTEGEYFDLVIPELCRRIIGYHQASREPEPTLTALLSEAARRALIDPAMVPGFHEQMDRVAALPGRAKPENRLHRYKGCALCRSACRYGYFSLVSEPPVRQLQDLLKAEMAKPIAGQSAIVPLYNFTLGHLSALAQGQKIYIDIRRLADLCYCLLMLGMARSRLVPPTRQLELLQAANLENVLNYK